MVVTPVLLFFVEKVDARLGGGRDCRRAQCYQQPLGPLLVAAEGPVVTSNHRSVVTNDGNHGTWC